MAKRFCILLATEFKAWRHDPITAMGGFIPPLFILIAFGLLFGGRLTFKIACINHDSGAYGAVLRQAFDQTLSPFRTPYYDVLGLEEEAAWAAYRSFRIDGVWVIPADFSRRVELGQAPRLEMHFNNYNDDRAKNHRIYSAEILWRFYREIGLPGPPLELAEQYPLPEFIDWFPIISVGVALLSFMLGGMMNIFMLTYKEQLAGITLEFGLAPRSLAWVLAPKLLLALVMGLLTGTGLLLVVYLWTGAWPGGYLWAVYLLASLVILFWSPLTMLLALRSRYFTGAVAVILTGITAFLIGGGLGLVRYNEKFVPWFSWLFPNTHAIDPLRDLVLFHAWPVDWRLTLLKLAGFAALSLVVCLGMAARRLRRVG
ncbi:MAG: ABC transporter permease [Anaerolineales bacterium]|nr:ABC transporter permease [Anaerolineales bacterium]